jgi:tyrosine-specific transport protein
MLSKNKQFFKALFLLLGVVFGAGIFGLPYAISQSGWLLGLIYFITLGLIILLIHLMYGEIVLRTNERHRLPGFVTKFIGPKYGNFIKFASTIGLWASLLAYILIGGRFLFLISKPFLGGNEFLYQIIFFGFSALIIISGIKMLSKIEVILTSILVFILIFIGAISLKHIHLNNLPIQVNDFFLPYGIILFSLFGASAIPEMKDILSGQLSKLKSIIIWGSIITLSITIFFAFTSLGVSGLNVSQDGISGLVPALGPWVLYLGSILGFLATFTSFLVIGTYLKEQFQLDFKKNEIASVFWSIGIPFIILILINPNFIQIIGFAGTVFGAIDSIFLIIVWQKAKIKSDRKPEYEIKIKKWFSFVLLGLFLIGAIYEIYTLLN